MSLGRRAGLLVPLSAVRSRSDLGLGDPAALSPLVDWMRSAGLTVLQVLPLHDLGPEDSCPYASVSAFALDWAMIALGDVPALAGDPEACSPCAEKLREIPRARFSSTRAFKRRLLEKAFAASPAPDPEWCAREAHWLEDYALFRALKEESGWRPWREWPEGLRDRRPEALEEARKRLARPIALHRWLQWTADAQWRAARAAAAERGILLYGDVPFGVSTESADVWAHQEDFEPGVSMGAPPDQYSATGQDWDLPAYRWERMEAAGHPWWRARLRRTCGLFDLVRLDHAVGFYRTWRIPRGGGPPGFDVPTDEAARARGRRFLTMVLEECRGRAEVVAEDLGLIPPFVREVLAELGIPGYKVTRWERYADGFADPRFYPALSAAAIGNHDTSPLAAWWDEMPEWERARYWRMVSGEDGSPAFSPRVHELVLKNLYAAGSDLVVLCFQDVDGSKDRINVPGTVGEHNWTWRMPRAAEDLDAAAAAWLRRLAVESGRKTC